jgi:L-iditol 2-dehydrogenase
MACRVKRAPLPDRVPETMTAVVFRGPDDLRVEQLAVPQIRADELLVKVGVCGVCPTDIKKISHGTVPPPRVFGHETAGTIVRVGARLRGFSVGERVALHHHVPCRSCHACRHRAFAQCATYKRTGITAGFAPAGGGYAEYVRVMAFVLPGVVKIPAGNSLLEGAMLEPVNTVLKAVRRLTLQPGDRVLVAGQGPIGLMFTRLLALAGLRVLATDLMPERLARAHEFGATRCLRGDDPRLAEHVTRWAGRPGLDAVVVAVPSDELVTDALELVRGAGQVLVFAHTKRGALAGVDLAAVCVEEKDLIGSYSSDIRLQTEVARLVFRRAFDVRPLVTHQFPLVQTAAAVARAALPGPDSLKVVVNHALVPLVAVPAV